MVNYAVNELRVDKDDCMVEYESQNTHQNIEFSLKLLYEGSWFKPTYTMNYTFTICTSTFHIKRSFLIASFLCKDYGKVAVVHTNEKISSEQHKRETKFINDYLGYLISNSESHT